MIFSGSNHNFVFRRKRIFEIWSSKTGSNAYKKRFVMECFENVISETDRTITFNMDGLETHMDYICTRLSVLWKQSKRNRSYFLSKNKSWLSEEDHVELQVPKATKRLSTTTRGRPKQNFDVCSPRAKRLRLAELSAADPSAYKYLRKSQTTVSNRFTTIHPDEVVSFIVEPKLTKHQYMTIKKIVNNKFSSDILPSYQKVLKAKTSCYPEKRKVSETVSEVDLQSLLDHTASRIIKSLPETVTTDSPLNEGTTAILIGKWGFDGSSGHSEYKQCFSDSNAEDSNMFITSYVPLRLMMGDTILWKNATPSSTRFCRPIRLQFAKETKDLTTQEERYIKGQIETLIPSSVKSKNCLFQIEHKLQLTMIDGKCCSALCETSSCRCYLCGAKPTEMNDIEKSLQKSVSDRGFEFGLSPLHSWIRFFEYLLHVCYRLEIRKWQARSAEEKESVAKRKKLIQTGLREKLGLIVDKPKSGGSGTSNDGNTARKFFKCSQITAEITGLKVQLLERCRTILQSLSSGCEINTVKFKEYALNTARMLVEEYPWYYLPPSVHKVLIHGDLVIDHALVSIGELSEEAAESNNKNIKNFRLNHTRKMSRVATNTDLLQRLLLNSDPFITSLRQLSKPNKPELPQEVMELLYV